MPRIFSFQVFLLDNFVFNGGPPFREGSGNDVGKLTTCFKEVLGFIHDPNNDCKSNLTCEEMKNCCENWASQKHHDVDCIILAILTHGSYPDRLQGYGGNYIALEELLSPFGRGNATLVGKPKIFFIQACRGDKTNIGVLDRATTSGKNTKIANTSFSWDFFFKLTVLEHGLIEISYLLIQCDPRY